MKLGTNYPWAKGIKVSSSKGSAPLQRGDNHKNVKRKKKKERKKKRWSNLNFFFSRTTGVYN
jgi:hypothetical protein